MCFWKIKQAAIFWNLKKDKQRMDNEKNFSFIGIAFRIFMKKNFLTEAVWL